MSRNNLKYTGLDVNTILRQITDKLASDSRFDNFRESAIAETLLEIFAGTTDINNYYIQRRAEENFFDFAQLRSSNISLARQLGYVPSRPSPARARISMRLEGEYGDFRNAFGSGKQNVIQIPYFSTFTADNNNFVLRQTLTFRIPNNVLNDIADTQSNDDTDIFTLDITQDSFGQDIEIVEGIIKEKVINGATNNQVGSNFQIYKIEDLKFSNLYGDNDIFHNKVTRVYVGDVKNEDTRFEIDRRSLINWESFRNRDIDSAARICVIRTTPDEFVELLFGDGRFAEKGPITRKDNIYIQYLATNGSESNQIGVIGNEIEYNGNIFTAEGEDISDLISFNLLSNITGGSDFESSESIKYSAPKIYYALDRLVSKDDYIAYLKSLTTPINVKNAIAWGEQEQRDRLKTFADMKSFNVAFFTVLGSLYDLEGDTFIVKTPETDLDSALLDIDFQEDSINDQSYFNVYSRQRIAQQLKLYQIKETFNVFYGRNFDEIDDFFDGSDLDYDELFNQLPNTDLSLIIEYTSDDDKFSNNITEIKLIDDLDWTIDTKTGLFEFIKDTLNDVIDTRGSSLDNENLGQPAFLVDEVRWNENQKRIEIIFDKDSPCKLTSILSSRRIDGTTRQTSALFNSVRLIEGCSEILSITVEDKVISNKIIQVIEDLDSRSQMVVRNVYVSPTIHNFNIEGNIYLRSLYDRDEEKREIGNAIYEWLDLNADFNVPIHKSNIVDIIENFPSVNNANIRIVPTDITRGRWIDDGGTIRGRDIDGNIYVNRYFIGSTDSILTKYTNRLDVLLTNSLVQYFNRYSVDNGYIAYDDRKFVYGHSPATRLLTYQLTTGITVRNFYDNFVTDFYNRIIREINLSTVPSNVKQSLEEFIGISNEEDVFFINRDFTILIDRIYKDLSFVIKSNMLDSHGNIEPEFENGTLIRGGYSLGSEIVKIDFSNVNVLYK